MKKLIAVFCLSVAVLVPAAAQAFTVYSPVFPNRLLMECIVLNVGSIVLQAAPFWIAEDGQKVPDAPVWVDLLPGADTAIGAYNPVPNKSCGFWVRAKNPRRAATRGMVRGVVHVIDSDGRRVAMELK